MKLKQAISTNVFYENQHIVTKAAATAIAAETSDEEEEDNNNNNKDDDNHVDDINNVYAATRECLNRNLRTINK